jgi:hypothetical protein
MVNIRFLKLLSNGNCPASIFVVPIFLYVVMPMHYCIPQWLAILPVVLCVSLCGHVYIHYCIPQWLAILPVVLCVSVCGHVYALLYSTVTGHSSCRAVCLYVVMSMHYCIPQWLAILPVMLCVCMWSCLCTTVFHSDWPFSLSCCVCLYVVMSMHYCIPQWWAFFLHVCYELQKWKNMWHVRKLNQLVVPYDSQMRPKQLIHFIFFTVFLSMCVTGSQIWGNISYRLLRMKCAALHMMFL